MFLQLL